jgi:formate hydrogenlyase subunit 4
MIRLATLAALLLLAACATQSATAVAPAAPGFLFGVWHGFVFPVAWVLSLFMPDVAVYAVPNNGGWYDFGYFLGIVVFGVGARKSRTVYVARKVRG